MWLTVARNCNWSFCEMFEEETTGFNRVSSNSFLLDTFPGLGQLLSI